ncbi:MAG: 6,7-dimethyl-8-ribityllumazine synthase [Alphaproteobacteria bacterium HGW-Alphaproteobacteria-6]|nr:MAG: 6,7-dimethyl-8-ribityllumazine synthase [Alphaproteobacteria bacterium HGW-Alphaproteobacteria-6]
MATHDTHATLPLPRFEAPVRLLIVVAPYYRDIADALIAGARAMAERAGASVDLVEVPGALEVPAAIGMAARLADYDGFVALGCVIRGETTHYDTVCNDSSRGLTLLGLQGVCIGNGILTVENRDQAVVRADPAGQDKGGGAAAAALHLVALSRQWARKTKGIGFRPEGGSFRIAEGPAGEGPSRT